MTNHKLEVPPIADRRPKARRKALLGGVLVWEGGSQTTPCVIRNISLTGALVSTPSRELPKELHLINVRGQCAHRAEVVWVMKAQAGLRFLDVIDLAQDVQGTHSYLRKLLDAYEGR